MRLSQVATAQNVETFHFQVSQICGVVVMERLSWGNGEENQCHFDYSVNLDNATQMQQYEKVCQ